MKTGSDSLKILLNARLLKDVSVLGFAHYKRMPRVTVGVARYLKIPHCSMTMSAKHRSIFAALHL